MESAESDLLFTPSNEEIRARRMEHFQNQESLQLVKIKRSNVRADMIAKFKDISIAQSIQFTFIDPRGEREAGVGSGVTRDIYSTFWEELSEHCFIGAQSRVPIVCHDMYKDEWNAVGRILVKGYSDVGYFPTIISSAFIFYCLFGEPSDEILMASFKQYLPADEHVLMESMLSPDG